jgi:hypothetical protein
LEPATAKKVRSVRLTQIGYLRLKPGSKAVDFSAAQIMSVVEVGFLWRAWFRMAGVSMQIIDYVVGSEAGLEGRLLSSVPVVRMTGSDAMFRGEAMRYLAELMWNPDAILFNPQLTWRVLDARTLAVATGEGARRCEVRLILNEDGDRSAHRTPGTFGASKRSEGPHLDPPGAGPQSRTRDHRDRCA